MPRAVDTEKRNHEIIEYAMANPYVTNHEIADRYGIHESLVRRIIKKHDDEAEECRKVVKVRDNAAKMKGEQKRKKTEEYNTTISDLLDNVLKKSLQRLDAILDDKDTAIPFNHLTTTAGIAYDKRALLNKEATTIVDASVTISKFEDL